MLNEVADLGKIAPVASERERHSDLQAYPDQAPGRYRTQYRVSTTSTELTHINLECGLAGVAC